MNIRARLLNGWLRWTEKTFLTRATSITALRASFEIKAALFFHAPFGITRTWRDLAARPALRLHPTGADPCCTILYFHGGAHVFGSPRTASAMLSHLVKKGCVHAILPQYPLAPENPFPAAIDHALASYHALLDDGVDPASIIIGGDSAGGNLALSLLAQLVVRDAPMPAGAFAFSPVTDMSFSGASIVENAASDVVLPATRIAEMAQAYLGNHPPDDPCASPLFAQFEGAPPVWLTVGDTEILYDDSLRMAERLRAQGVAVDLTVEHDLPHVWPMFHTLIPQAGATLDALAVWIAVQTGLRDPTR